MVLSNSRPAATLCIYWWSAFLCGLTILSCQRVCADGDILLFSLIKWAPAVECRADTRVRWWCVWEPERRVSLFNLQCSRKHADSLVSPSRSRFFLLLLGSESLWLCCQLFPHFRCQLFAVYVPFISSGNASCHCPMIQFHLSMHPVVGISGRV